MALPPAVLKPRVSVTRYPPGEQERALGQGDFLLTHGAAWTSRLIRFGEAIRYRGRNRLFAHWSHAVAARRSFTDARLFLLR
jgi:hypothetical protein